MGILHPHLVEAKIRVKLWCWRVTGYEKIQVVKASDLIKVRYKIRYENNLKQRWETLYGEVLEGAVRS